MSDVKTELAKLRKRAFRHDPRSQVSIDRQRLVVISEDLLGVLTDLIEAVQTCREGTAITNVDFAVAFEDALDNALDAINECQPWSGHLKGCGDG